MFEKVKLADDTTIVTKWHEQGDYKVPLSTCVPNNWNMNKVEPRMMDKLRLVIKETLEESNGKLPPITVRPHPKKKKLLQIVDGEHRWKILGELGCDEIDVTVLHLTDQRAMSMTAELNYNRGEPDPEKYPQYLARMIKEFDEVNPSYLAERLPDSEDEIRSYLESANLEIDNVILDEDDDDEVMTHDASETDMLVEMKFTLHQGQAEIVQAELTRLGNTFGGGKNIQGRALEYMAVLSSQTPLGSMESFSDDDEAPKRKKKKKKKREEAS